MTKRHFEAVASLLAQLRADGVTRELDPGKQLDSYTLNEVTIRLAELFEQENPRFDAQRFYEAANLANLSPGLDWRDPRAN